MLAPPQSPIERKVWFAACVTASINAPRSSIIAFEKQAIALVRALAIAP